MATSEPARIALYSRLEELLGDKHAETLMKYLPAARLEMRMDRLELSIDQLTIQVREMHGVMRDQLRTCTITTVGAMTALTGIFGMIVAITG